MLLGLGNGDVLDHVFARYRPNTALPGDSVRRARTLPDFRRLRILGSVFELEIEGRSVRRWCFPREICSKLGKSRPDVDILARAGGGGCPSRGLALCCHVTAQPRHEFVQVDVFDTCEIALSAILNRILVAKCENEGDTLSKY